MLDFQKLDPFWNLWSKPNPGISSKMLYPARLNHNQERKIGHEIFVKTEKTEYLSNQLTSAHFDRKFIFPTKFGTSEQIFIFWISKIFQISKTATVKLILQCIYICYSFMFLHLKPPFLSLNFDLTKYEFRMQHQTTALSISTVFSNE